MITIILEPLSPKNEKPGFFSCFLWLHKSELFCVSDCVVGGTEVDDTGGGPQLVLLLQLPQALATCHLPSDFLSLTIKI